MALFESIRRIDRVDPTAGRIADYRGIQDQDAFLESLGNLAPDICLIDFDKDRHTAAIVAERIHSGLPETAAFALSSQTHPEAILEAMRSGCGNIW